MHHAQARSTWAISFFSPFFIHQSTNFASNGLSFLITDSMFGVKASQAIWLNFSTGIKNAQATHCLTFDVTSGPACGDSSGFLCATSERPPYLASPF